MLWRDLQASLTLDKALMVTKSNDVHLKFAKICQNDYIDLWEKIYG